MASQHAHHAASRASQARRRPSRRPASSRRACTSSAGAARLSTGTNHAMAIMRGVAPAWRSQAKYEQPAATVAQTTRSMSTANHVTAPTTASAPGAWGLLPSTATCRASSLPRASSKTTRHVRVAIWAASAR